MSASIEFQAEVDRLKASISISNIISASVTLKRHGREFTACCPFHGEKTPSFSVNDAKGFYHCFGCGEHGDVFDWLSKKSGMTLKDAVTHLSGNIALPVANVGTDTPTVTHIAIQEWTPIVPVPEHAAAPPKAHFRHGKPVHVAEYRTVDGGLIGLILRCQPEGGKKEILPLAFCERASDARQEWRWVSQSKPRSIYGAELLGRGGRVLIVEGETTADAARRLVGDRFTVITWPGGSQAVHHVDWSLLAGRDCVIWPDADPAGVTAAASITVQLRHHGATVRTVDVPDEAPKGWDLADAETESWSGDRVLRVIDPPEPEPVDEPDYDTGWVEAQRPFIPLGHDEGKFFFMCNGGGQVRDFTAAQLQTFGSLVELASLQHWEAEYPSKSGANLKSAGNDLVQMCNRVGVYDPNRVRGRGTWIDEGRIVVHMGDRLLVDGVESGLTLKDSHYIYENARRMHMDITNALLNAEADKLRKLCAMLPWEAPDLMGNLLAGWCVIAPVCGALNWRPHIWLSGESGSGKSWTLENIIKLALGLIAFEVVGKSTEAGIRQHLLRDGRPVLFDEAETQNEQDRARMQQVLDSARVASSESSAIVAKGSASGKPSAFRMKSCFMFGSVNVGATQAADESRMVVLTLRPIKDLAERARRFEEIERFHATMAVENFSGRLFARTVSLLHVIRRNAVVFAEAIARSGKPRRLGDTYGTLLAGAWSLRSRAVATTEEADAMVRETQWVKDAVVKGDVEPEWSRALKTLLQYRVRVNSGRVADIPIGDLIEAAQFGAADGPIGSSDAARELNYLGLRVRDGYLLVAANSRECSKIFERTPWGASWASTMQRTPGTKHGNGQVKMAGINARPFGIPVLELSK